MKVLIMTKSPNNFLNDLSRLASDAVGAAQGVKKDVETGMRIQIEKIMKELDITTHEDTDIIKEMALKALEQNKLFNERISTLEAKISELEKK